nr:short chain dehydrogenase [uncultured bacterium]
MANDRRVALVTGGAKRVGRAIVQRLVAGGFDVCITYHHTEPDLAELGAAQSICVDLADAKSLDAVESAFRWDRLDLLVNNASAYEQSTLADVTLEHVRKMMAVHVESPLRLCQLFEKRLRASHGHIVNMIDLLAERPWPKYLAYCASKAALANLTLNLARTLAPEVTVNGIAPGVVAWPDDYPEDERLKYLKRVPLARPGTPQDVANLVHFLATEGSYITGQIIRLDGGRSIT